MASNWIDRLRIATYICISATSMFLGGYYVFGHTNWKLDEKAIGFLVAAALPWFMNRLESFKGWGFEFKQQLKAQSAVIEQQQELVNLMFWFSMEADMFDTLKNLVEAPTFIHNPSDLRFYPIVNTQLKELFNRGFIEKDPSSIAANEDIGRGSIVTDLGKQFVQERKRLEEKGGRERLKQLSPLAQ